MTNKELRQERKPKYKRIVKLLWLANILVAVGAFTWFVALSLSPDMPSVSELENPQDNLASEVIGPSGDLVGRYYYENRVPVDYDQIPPHLIDALLSTEDARFYKHSGIDFRALPRVVQGLVSGSSKGGGSTITQQLAKLLFSERDIRGNKLVKIFKLVNVKFKEWIMAVKLERRYTKEEIMTMYLNHFDFIYGAHGIKSASETYFGKTQDSLSITESAILVGMLQNPTLWNPKRFPEKAKLRRDVVMKQMVKYERLDNDRYYQLVKEPVVLNFKRETHSEGLAPYFREELRKEIKSILAEEEIRSGRNYNVHTDGLKIYVTIDNKMQAHAEKVMEDHMKSLQGKFWKHWKDKDPWTYQARSQDKKLREKSFERVVRASERYQKLADVHLGDIIETIKSNFDIELKDYDIERLLEVDKNDKYLAELLDNGYITKEKASLYRKILKSNDFKTLKNTQRKLDKAADAAFSKKVKMKVFTWENEKFEKDTLMSPYDSIRYHRMHLQTGIMAVDPKTGAIRAWVGGINHRYFKYDHVNKNVERQVGSTFKPFLYATAIDNSINVSPCSKVIDMQYCIHPKEGDFDLLKDWCPKNSGGKFDDGEVTLQVGLQKSLNSVSVFLIKQLGSTKPVLEVLSNMGFDVDAKTANGQYRIPRQPSIALGATDLSVFDMTGAYTTFANNGIYQKPYFIEKIVDKQGNVIYENIPDFKQALHPHANYAMVDMLKKVYGYRGVNSEAGGKTGTTNEHADGWFMGITPDLVVGTWVGGDDRWVRFRSLALGQGAVMARPMFTKFIKAVEKDTSITGYSTQSRFKMPVGELAMNIDCDAIEGYDEDEGGFSSDPTDMDNFNPSDSPDAGFFDDFGDDGGGSSPPPNFPSDNSGGDAERQDDDFFDDGR